ncbi:hypothetical protein B0H15DRAFT_955873 [Mycena belliarum]|uniref:Uncharacterized protein n=1 Tax=Mycena belliarum TaxID=1033014 RepID=A0AAD6TVI0_9AGAR|nr:hypothetical protein B0H15DRAFT_955873 [Mycena belliae]
MSFLASILLASAVGSSMGLKLNVPTGVVSDGTFTASWTTVAGDPKFSMLLIDSTGETFDIATGIDPTTLNTTVGLGFVPAGSYTLQAFNAGDISKVLDTTTAFNVADAGAAPPAAPPVDNGQAASTAAVTTAAATTAAATTAAVTTAAETTAAAATTAVAGTASAGGPPFDPAGVPNVGNGKGKQFIGGQCLSQADCASGCCAGPSGICSGPGASTQAGKTGCGFDSAAGKSPANSAPVASPAQTGKTGNNVGGTASAGGPTFDPAGVPHVGNGKGEQFIGGQCLSQADCASGCCAGPSGICSGPGASTQAGKTGCGFISKRFVSRRRSA